MPQIKCSPKVRQETFREHYRMKKNLIENQEVKNLLILT